MSEKILLVEDETKIARTVRLYLEEAGYQVEVVNDGALAMPAFRSDQPALIILDLMLPNVDGWALCRQLRQISGVPIIMLTARNDETDRIIGLELGADDYITKPFSPREVVARVRAVLRRSQGMIQPPQNVQTGDIAIDLERREVTVAGQSVELTAFEFDLLVVLTRHPRRVFTRLKLLEQIEDAPAYAGYERTIDQHVKNLRSKLGDSARSPRYIATVHGVGYKFVGEEHADA